MAAAGCGDEASAQAYVSQLMGRIGADLAALVAQPGFPAASQRADVQLQVR
jgi:hypothetical protein